MTPSLDTGGRNAVIQSGNCIIKGQLWRCDAAVSTPIPVASGQNRIDRLVIQYNRSATTSPTVIQPIVITGTPGSSPSEPPIVQTPTGLFQIPVCSWTSASSGALTGLVDERIFTLDTWHTIPLDSGWTNWASYAPAQYRMIGRNNIQLAGAAAIASAVTGGAHNINSGSPLPVPYRPASTHDYRTSDNIGTRCHISLSNQGVLVATPYPSWVSGNGLVAELDGIVPLV
jgi:hypothetical protein